MLHFGFGGHARAVDVVHARTDVVGVFEFTKRGQQIHVGARSFNGNHIRIHAGDGGQDVVELAVTHMGVDLRAVGCAHAGKAEALARPSQVFIPLRFFQRQRFADGGFVDLNHGDARAFQIQHFIVQRKCDLFGNGGKRHIVAHKRPFKHGNGPCEHAFHRAFGEALRVARPVNRHRVGARYIAIDDGRFHTAAAVALHPAKLAETITRQLFAKIFHHIVALGFAVYQHVNAQFFLLGNAVGDFFFHRCIIIGSRKFAFFERSARLADFGGLRE